MPDEHLDRQPPRDEREARLQDEHFRDAAAAASTETTTPAPAEDVDEDVPSDVADDADAG